ncbi:hypothetical protein P692DRAFT_20878967 [Suillus brevipes Sb2]|nr:hypothetical protein P692DRAFT_20878967 [Suillus brevipes Sb2]
MLDSLEKEVIKVGGEDHKDKGKASQDGEKSRRVVDSAEPSNDSDSKQNSESEVENSNSASETDEPLCKKQQGFKLDLFNLTNPSVNRRTKKLSPSLRKTNTILAN